MKLKGSVCDLEIPVSPQFAKDHTEKLIQDQDMLQAKHNGVGLDRLFSFLDGVLKYNPQERMTAEGALEHIWLQEE